MISIKDVWDDAKAHHEAYVTGRLSELLKLNVGQSGYIEPPSLRKFMERNLPHFATGNVDTLRKLIVDATKTLDALRAEDEKTAFKRAARRAFDYSTFCQKSTKPWSAYKLCEKAKRIICPYCNQAFAFTVVGTSTSFRPTLDHFFPKADYPYLALSLYNLVPSCYVCNSSLKGKKNFFVEHHLHPLEDGDADEVRFDLVSSDNAYTFADLLHDDNLLNDFGRLEPHPHSPKAAASIETFLLRERFATNLPAIKRFIRLRKKFRPSKIEQYRRFFGEDFSISEHLQFDVSEYKDHMLGKVLRDMYSAFNPLNEGDEQ
ncbi:hypothetical protein AWB71_02809 [Caballeronia peredens]|nr:hypothetical protein AWB71_02809 [Caballeronia peredens]